MRLGSFHPGLMRISQLATWAPACCRVAGAGTSLHGHQVSRGTHLQGWCPREARGGPCLLSPSLTAVLPGNSRAQQIRLGQCFGLMFVISGGWWLNRPDPDKNFLKKTKTIPSVSSWLIWNLAGNQNPFRNGLSCGPQCRHLQRFFKHEYINKGRVIMDYLYDEGADTFRIEVAGAGFPLRAPPMPSHGTLSSCAPWLSGHSLLSTQSQECPDAAGEYPYTCGPEWMESWLLLVTHLLSCAYSVLKRSLPMPVCFGGFVLGDKGSWE